jgi:5-oxoprolinase (ATP-hydrolysing) subunit A
MHRVDLNSDLGESFGAFTIGNDEELFEFITSANVACGFHAGDPSVMRRTVGLAVEKDIAVGAHPGYRDLEGFGRRFMDITPAEAYDLVLYQIGALFAIAHTEGVGLSHVKAHGALYNAASTNPRLADAIADAVRQFDPGLILYGLAGSELINAGERAGLRTASEAFADRSYQIDGSLTPRRRPGAMIEDEEVAIQRAIRMVTEGKVEAQQGGDIDLHVDTICIHGDGPHAASFARSIRSRLEESEVEVKRVDAKDG